MMVFEFLYITRRGSRKGRRVSRKEEGGGRK
jgi:hypothetical protein